MVGGDVVIKVCEYCSKEYKTYRSYSKFCSRKCSSLNQKKKVTDTCKMCNEPFDHYQYLNRVFCSAKCRNLYQSKNPTTLYEENEIKEMLSISGYELIGKYNGMNEPTMIKHLDCEKAYDRRPSAILNSKKRCKYCTHRSYKKSQSEYVHEVSVKTNGEYTVVGDYTGNKNKVRLRHNICGYEWESVATSILQGHGCPKCKESNGEKMICHILKKLEINFIREYRIKECRLKRPLPFDFALFKNNELFCLIEYQGEQHYRKRKNALFNEKLSDRKRKDDIKRTFCKENNIKLIEIPYYLDDVEQYLKYQLYANTEPS